MVGGSPLRLHSHTTLLVGLKPESAGHCIWMESSLENPTSLCPSLHSRGREVEPCPHALSLRYCAFKSTTCTEFVSTLESTQGLFPLSEGGGTPRAVSSPVTRCAQVKAGSSTLR